MGFIFFIILILIIVLIIKKRASNSVTEKVVKTHYSPTTQESPYADSRRLTKTGRARARGSEYDADRGWFGVDKTIIKSPDLSKPTKIVYSYLSRIADQNGYCFPFIKTIAKRCNISSSTVIKSIKELEQQGLVTKVVHRSSRRGGSSTLYRIYKYYQK